MYDVSYSLTDHISWLIIFIFDKLIKFKLSRAIGKDANCTSKFIYIKEYAYIRKMYIRYQYVGLGGKKNPHDFNVLKKRKRL